MIKSYKKLALVLFGGIVDRYINYFKDLEDHLETAHLRILLKPWISMAFLTSTISFFSSILIIYILNLIFKFGIFIYVFSLFFLPIIIALLTFVFFYFYPIEREKSILRSINLNLPFAVIHMSAIVSSGIPPEFMFELLSESKEYGEIANECKLIVRNMKTFGMSSVDAIKNVAHITPSKEFKEILMGISSTIEKGGDLVAYLKEMGESALFNYRIAREKYVRTLSTYADIYTALLIAAPLMMLIVLIMMGMIGGNVGGLTIEQAILLITWVVLPVMNMIFLAVLHITYPGI